ncbi:hypothetical protein DL237_12555 [Pseudooceanicola sediminis]|uniref:Uncharacterized protein n=1 Tax=Pseudooceanicola sediminis TaxID=2211117 RepID=A0A399IZA4_9RHOB|nr:hypothetical protein [Pseudooceanicola sediminis]KAA2313379.1 hypothetical protein E0K93_14300 [Puniceibacterium sp. HSS470]RII38340.1 hypothetical protein DL237_12555 [Pseudooceanicola sediminis]|tara:strand:- start:33547 stop:34965 length:1419 start_codon:yes stop_codon:yes gene_type:complete
MRDEPRDQEPATAAQKLIGGLLAGVVVLVILRSWVDWWVFDALANAGTVAAIALLTPQVRWSRQIFVVLGLALVAYAWIAAPDQALAVLGHALERASFILAFFCALATLRHTAEISAAITRAAVFLAQQPPGRRYSALALGGQTFALVLNYGSISLLGSMARTSAAREPDLEVRAIRTRRMLQAVHRGFAASLMWSPLSFAIVISTTVVPGASWGAILLPAVGSAALLTGIGWGLDKAYKSKLAPGRVPVRDRSHDDHARVLLPVLWLLGLIAGPVALLHFTTGQSASLSVLSVVPVVAGLWLLIGGPVGARGRHLGGHVGAFVFRELPAFRGEIVLLTMAGFLGSGAGALLAPVVAASGLDLTAIPVWVLLLLPIWLIPLGGQVGMNPILFVSLFGPLLPAPEVLGISPTPMVLALTAGWALSGVTSPFTASVMLIARLGDVTPADVSLRWNGAFSLICALVLSVWVLLLA